MQLPDDPDRIIYFSGHAEPPRLVGSVNNFDRVELFIGALHGARPAQHAS